MGIAAGKICFAVEQFKAAYEEALPLLKAHWDEIAKNKALLRLNPDVTLYERMGQNLLLITARFDGQLVGYFLWFLIRHPHYAHVSVAEEDLHFLLREHRRGLAGYKFVKAASGAGTAAGDTYKAETLDRAATYGDLKATQTGAQLTRNLSVTTRSVPRPAPIRPHRRALPCVVTPNRSAPNKRTFRTIASWRSRRRMRRTPHICVAHRARRCCPATSAHSAVA
jgi:hypothetical protein